MYPVSRGTSHSGSAENLLDEGNLRYVVIRTGKRSVDNPWSSLAEMMTKFRLRRVAKTHPPRQWFASLKKFIEWKKVKLARTKN